MRGHDVQCALVDEWGPSLDRDDRDTRARLEDRGERASMPVEM